MTTTWKKFTLLAATLALTTLPAIAGGLTDMPSQSTLSTDIVQVSPTVPAMGAHWANPATLPLGPIYCVHEGKIVCLEFMISQADFAAGKSGLDLAGRTDLPPIDHIDIGFQQHGHEGFTVPHYDIHIYFIPAAEVAQIH